MNELIDNLRLGYATNLDNVMAYGKVLVGKDQEKEQSEKDSNSEHRGGKKLN